MAAGEYIGGLNVKIGADVINFKKGIDEVSDKVGKFAKKVKGDTEKASFSFSNLSDKFSQFSGLLMGGIAGTAIATIGKQLIDMGINVEQVNAKAKIAFGGYQNIVTEASQKMASSMGLTNTEYLKSAAGISSMLNPLNLTKKSAAEVSVKLMDMASSLSKYSAGAKTTAEMSDVIGAALRGEMDGIEEFGIKISDADIQQRLFQAGQLGMTGKSAEQAKAIATLNLIMEQGAKLNLDYAGSTDNLTSSWNTFSVKIKEVGEEMAVAFKPALKFLLDEGSTFVSGIDALINDVKSALSGKNGVSSLAMLQYGGLGFNQGTQGKPAQTGNALEGSPYFSAIQDMADLKLTFDKLPKFKGLIESINGEVTSLKFLLDNTWDPNRIKQYTIAIEKLNEKIKNIQDVSTPSALEPLGVKKISGSQAPKMDLAYMESTSQKFTAILNNMKQTAIDIGPVIEDSLNEMFNSLGQTVGEFAVKLAQGTANFSDFADAIGQDVLGAFADFGNKLGQLCISAGIAGLAIQESIAAQPWVAIAAGVALVAASAAIKSTLSAGPSVSGGVSAGSYAGGSGKGLTPIAVPKVEFFISGKDLKGVLVREDNRSSIGR